MLFIAKLGLVITLSALYAAYLVEMYRHLTNPLKPLHHMNRKKKIIRLIIFFTGITITILLAYTIRELVVPRPIFDLIVVSLQAIFIIPFFGAIFTDRLLHAWRKRRLPYSISLINIAITTGIALITNLIILFGPLELIEQTTKILSVATDIIAVCLILGLATLGFGYWQSAKK